MRAAPPCLVRNQQPTSNHSIREPKMVRECHFKPLTTIGASLCGLITGSHVPCRQLKSRELICRYIALAADLGGAFAIARMQPCFQVAVKIATVVAARLK